ncbi:MAG: hypothetical protein MJ252_12390, partial [archaeon]|nr:hypothetical protein [archaeon]
HIKLSDFGLSKMSDKIFFPMSCKEDDSKMPYNPKDIITVHRPGAGGFSANSSRSLAYQTKKRNRLMAFSTVGTPDYIAPEVFGKEGYGPEVDWWSIGVMFFEMVCGYPPFFCENPGDTCKKIAKWKTYFSIPNEPPLSNEAKNLILRFVTYPQSRLGINGVEEIKAHPFFKGIDWDNIRNTKAPFIPDLKNDWDTKYFDQFEEEEPFYPPIVKKKDKRRKDANYPGYTFNRDLDNMNSGFVCALEEIEAIKQNLQNEKEESEEEDNEGKGGDDTAIFCDGGQNETEDKSTQRTKEAMNNLYDVEDAPCQIPNKPNEMHIKTNTIENNFQQNDKDQPSLSLQMALRAAEEGRMQDSLKKDNRNSMRKTDGFKGNNFSNTNSIPYNKITKKDNSFEGHNKTNQINPPNSMRDSSKGSKGKEEGIKGKGNIIQISKASKGNEMPSIIKKLMNIENSNKKNYESNNIVGTQINKDLNMNFSQYKSSNSKGNKIGMEHNNKIIISNENNHSIQKKFSKSPDTKGNDKYKILPIQPKSQRFIVPGSAVKVTPSGKSTKERIALINKMKLNAVDTGVFKKPNLGGTYYAVGPSNISQKPGKYIIGNKK